jgi:hypothetical protein
MLVAGAFRSIEAIVIKIKRLYALAKLEAIVTTGDV